MNMTYLLRSLITKHLHNLLNMPGVYLSCRIKPACRPSPCWDKNTTTLKRPHFSVINVKLINAWSLSVNISHKYLIKVELLNKFLSPVISHLKQAPRSFILFEVAWVQVFYHVCYLAIHLVFLYINVRKSAWVLIRAGIHAYNGSALVSYMAGWL